jgi:hypothetical protein
MSGIVKSGGVRASMASDEGLIFLTNTAGDGLCSIGNGFRDYYWCPDSLQSFRQLVLPLSKVPFWRASRRPVPQRFAMLSIVISSFPLEKSP